MSFNPGVIAASRRRTVASIYAGLGDVATLTAYYGVRAGTQAYALAFGPALDLRRVSDNATMTAHFLANGDLDTAVIAAWAGVSSIAVPKAYDNIGSRHLTQGVAGQQPLLFLSGGPNGKPYIQLSNVATSGLNVAVSAPSSGNTSMSVVANRTGGNFGVFAASNGTAGNRIFPTGFAATWTLQGASGTCIANATNNAWHKAQGIINGASSALHLDSAAPVTGTITGSVAGGFSVWAPGASSSTVQSTEFGYWESNVWSPAQIAAIKTNQAGYYLL